MNNRTSFLLAGLIVGLWLPLAALAESAPDAARQADWTARLDKAAALIADGKALKEAATKALEEKTPACDQKFLVNACRNEARKEYLKASHEAQRLESEGKAIEREVKKEQVADSKQRKAEEAPQQATELAAREADNAAARQATQDKIEATQANKARQAEEGEKRKAAEAERLRQKQEAHARKQAEKMREAERRAAEAAAR